jgi:hypothetical protein
MGDVAIRTKIAKFKRPDRTVGRPTESIPHRLYLPQRREQKPRSNLFRSFTCGVLVRPRPSGTASILPIVQPVLVHFGNRSQLFHLTDLNDKH